MCFLNSNDRDYINLSNSTFTSKKYINILTKELSNSLKDYGFSKSHVVAKQILQAIDENTISYAKYRKMFTSILNNSKSFTWDIKKMHQAQCVTNSDELYTIKNLPFEKQNPFFTLTQRHRQGVRFASYDVSSILQDMLNKANAVAIAGVSFPDACCIDFDFSIAINDYIELTEKYKTTLKLHLKGVSSDGRFVFFNEAKGLYRKFSPFTALSSKDDIEKNKIDVRALTEFKHENDISTGLQSIMLNFYDQHSNKAGLGFTHIREYVKDKAHARQSLAKMHNNTINDVKIVVTSIAYGGLKQSYNFKTMPNAYRWFYDETKELSQYVADNVHLITDNEFRLYLSDKLKNKSKGKKDKNIIVYSVMEYYEKLIRDIMISHVPKGHRYQEVHDCIYSTCAIDQSLIMTDIKSILGFDIIID